MSDIIWSSAPSSGIAKGLANAGNTEVLNASGIGITDVFGNVISMRSNGIAISDAAGDSVTFNVGGSIEFEDINDNNLNLTDLGIFLEDLNSNVIDMNGTGGPSGTPQISLIVAGIKILSLVGPYAQFLVPEIPLSGTVATIQALTSPVEGMIAYATNGRKVGEGAGSGTGVPTYYSNGHWRVFSTDGNLAS